VGFRVLHPSFYNSLGWRASCVFPFISQQKEAFIPRKGMAFAYRNPGMQGRITITFSEIVRQTTECRPQPRGVIFRGIKRWNVDPSGKALSLKGSEKVSLCRRGESEIERDTFKCRYLALSILGLDLGYCPMSS
jgi:hypothetical protein